MFAKNYNDTFEFVNVIIHNIVDFLRTRRLIVDDVIEMSALGKLYIFINYKLNNKCYIFSKLEYHDDSFQDYESIYVGLNLLNLCIEYCVVFSG